MTSIGHIGKKLDLRIRQGADFLPYPVAIKGNSIPVDLTGCQIRAQLRKTALSSTLTVAFHTEIVESTVADPVNYPYKLRFWLTAAETAIIVCGERITDSSSRYVWDLEIEWADGTIDPLFYGDVLVFREVTRT